MTLSKFFQKQPIMRRVCYAITPLFVYSIFLYGYTPIYQLLVVFIAGILTEYLFEKKRNKKISEAVLVTCYLYGLSLPPNLPVWISIVGIVFAVFIAKCVFGGFGRNVFNPAITGRLFIYLSFPTALVTQYWCEASHLAQDVAVGLSFDAISHATPLGDLASGTIPSLLPMFLGLRTGSLGESPIFLLIIAAIYLIYTNTADWRPIVSSLITSVLFLAAIYFGGIMPGFGNPNVQEGIQVILAHLMAGSLIYMIVFMITDPITAPNNKKAKWYYGAIIAISTLIIRLFSGFPEGVSFGIMLGNTFACLLDEIIMQREAKQKAKKNATITQAATSAVHSVQKGDL